MNYTSSILAHPHLFNDDLDGRSAVKIESRRTQFGEISFWAITPFVPDSITDLSNDEVEGIVAAYVDEKSKTSIFRVIQLTTKNTPKTIAILGMPCEIVPCITNLDSVNGFDCEVLLGSEDETSTFANTRFATLVEECVKAFTEHDKLYFN